MARPTVFTKNTLQKLETAFSMDCTDEEACILANISPSTLYAYQKVNPEFLERKQLLRHKPILKARQVLIEALENPSYALRYLERKRRDEFGVNPRIVIEADDDPLSEEEKRKLDELLASPPQR